MVILAAGLSAVASVAVANYFGKPQMVVIENKELKIDRTTDFSNWKLIGQKNDLLFLDQVLSLNPDSYLLKNKISRRDPQGYIESPESISENAFVCTKFIPQSRAVDLTLRSRGSFQITIGDGDSRSIRVKQFSPANPNWDDVLPDAEFTEFTDRHGRYTLEQDLPLQKDTVACLTINSKPGGVTRKIVAELSLFGPEGPITLERKPSWTMKSDSVFNGITNFSIGLIDNNNDMPMIFLKGYCAVEMEDDTPSKEEKAACQNL